MQHVNTFSYRVWMFPTTLVICLDGCSNQYSHNIHRYSHKSTLSHLMTYSLKKSCYLSEMSAGLCCGNTVAELVLLFGKRKMYQEVLRKLKTPFVLHYGHGL